MFLFGAFDGKTSLGYSQVAHDFRPPFMFSC